MSIHGHILLEKLNKKFEAFFVIFFHNKHPKIKNASIIVGTKNQYLCKNSDFGIIISS